MADITEVPLEELLADIDEAMHDIDLCRMAVVMGMTSYNDRLIGNIDMVRKGIGELKRRLTLKSDQATKQEGEQNERQE